MKVLFIGAHIDDIELNCSGAVQKHIEKGDDVTFLTFSDCDETHLGIHQQYQKARDLLQIKQIVDCRFIQRIFSEQRQKILNQMLNINADIIYTHDQSDIHQDHLVVAEESIRAFRKSTIITYCNPRNMGEFIPNYFIDISDQILKTKIECVSCYTSQRKDYMSPEAIASSARFYGIMAGKKYAEAYRIIRMYG